MRVISNRRGETYFKRAFFNDTIGLDIQAGRKSSLRWKEIFFLLIHMLILFQIHFVKSMKPQIGSFSVTATAEGVWGRGLLRSLKIRTSSFLSPDPVRKVIRNHFEIDSFLGTTSTGDIPFFA